MSFFDLIQRRRSVRRFESRDVENEKLQKILEAANLAPSAGDLQAYEIVVVRDADRRRKLARAAYGQSFIEEAPVCLIFCANPQRNEWRYGERGRELYCIQDADIAASYAQLAATELGLGSCWVGAFDEDEVSRIINAGRTRPIIMLPIGYPAESPPRTPRRKIRELVHYESL